MGPKTVFITGCNRGIGYAFAQHYKNEGWNVIASVRNPDAAEKLNALKPWKVVTLDTSDENSIHKAAISLKEVPVHLLINNAGILKPGGFMDTTKEDLMRQFEVNTVGVFLMTRSFLPNLKLAAEKDGSAIVAQISSRIGSIQDNNSGGYYGYRASKVAVNMINKSFAHDLKRDNIISVTLHPGFVKTDMTQMKGTITPDESTAGLVKVLDGIKLQDTGKFLSYKGGVIPW
ncbi:hypothetical protein ABG067_000898 [Albugo candida]